MTTSPGEYEDYVDLALNESHETGQDQDSDNDEVEGFSLAGIERSVGRGLYS